MTVSFENPVAPGPRSSPSVTSPSAFNVFASQPATAARVCSASRCAGIGTGSTFSREGEPRTCSRRPARTGSRRAWHGGAMAEARIRPAEHARVRRLGVALLCVAVALLGSCIGILLVAHENARVGPVEVRFELQPSASGGSQVRVPPLGTMNFATHRGPLAVHGSVVELRADVARSLAQDPGGFATVGNRVGADLRRALIGLVARGVIAALLATAVLGLVVFRSVRRTALCLGLTTATLVATAGVSAATWRPASIREPRYTGLLASAPTAIGSAEQIVANFSQYRAALGQLVGNVVQLYDVTSTLPTYRPTGSTIALLHISDLHLNPAGIDLVNSLVSQFHIRGVIDTGDLTDDGSAAEQPFVDDLRRISVPYVGIRGNHDS